jgi:hypothetical protein
MKINALLIILFISFTIIALDSDDIERIGGTQLNGNGCVCHTTLASLDVHVWIDGPDTMLQGQSAIYKMYMAGGPAIAGGYNVAVRFGLLNHLDTLSVLIDNELTQSVPLPFSSTTDTIFWQFLYTAPDSIFIDTLYSVGLSTNWDTIPDDRDQWAYGPKFPVRIIQNSVPIELVSFNAEIINSQVMLKWSTASEKNNRGFEIERLVGDRQNAISKWNKIGFVEGKGTSSIYNFYSFQENAVLNGKIEYRLKQIDFNGSFSYSSVIIVENKNIFEGFSLGQNYPNPFNPSTRIQYQVSSYSRVSILVYDVLGNEIVKLADEYKPAGSYEVEFNPPSRIFQPASGVYYYQLKAGLFTETKKMILLK